MPEVMRTRSRVLKQGYATLSTPAVNGEAKGRFSTYWGQVGTPQGLGGGRAGALMFAAPPAVPDLTCKHCLGGAGAEEVGRSGHAVSWYSTKPACPRIEPVHTLRMHLC